jgi:hypothetical protein
MVLLVGGWLLVRKVRKGGKLSVVVELSIHSVTCPLQLQLT